MITNKSFKRFYTVKNLSVFSIIVLAVFLLVSCEGKPNLIGRELLEIDDTIAAVLVDTVSVYAYTVENEKILSFKEYYSPLGSLTHPVFGRTDAGVFSQFTWSFGYGLRTRKRIIEETATVSIYLAYTDYYGNESYDHDFYVYRITADIDNDLKSYSNVFATNEYYDEGDRLNTNTKATKSYRQLIQRNSQGIYDTLMYRILKIDLDYDRYKEELLDTLDNNYYYHVYNADSSSKQYVKRLKALYIKTIPVNAGGCIYKLDFINIHPANYISLKYKYINDEGLTKSDSLVYYSVSQDYFTGNIWHDNRTNIFSFNDHIGANIPGLNDTIHAQSELYLQSLGGTKILLKFPSLDTIKAQFTNKILNKAILTVPVDNEDVEMAGNDISYRLGLRYIQGGGENYLSDDAIFNYLGGYYDEENKEYNFNLTSYLNDFFRYESIENQGLVMFVSRSSGLTEYNATDYSGVKILNDESTKKIKLKFIYTNVY